MVTTRLITKSVVISLAICCVLAVAMVPTASAGYGDVRKFLRNPPAGVGTAKIWDVYWDCLANPPGRVCSIFTFGAYDDPPNNYGINILTSEDGIIIGIAGIFVGEWMGFDHKSAREFYNNFETHLYFDGEEVEIEVTPMRQGHFVDETGFRWVWWEWRIGATFKKGELDLGVYEFRQTFVEYGTVTFDTNDGPGPYLFQIV